MFFQTRGAWKVTAASPALVLTLGTRRQTCPRGPECSQCLVVKWLDVSGTETIYRLTKLEQRFKVTHLTHPSRRRDRWNGVWPASILGDVDHRQWREKARGRQRIEAGAVWSKDKGKTAQSSWLQDRAWMSGMIKKKEVWISRVGRSALFSAAFAAAAREPHWHSNNVLEELRRDSEGNCQPAQSGAGRRECRPAGGLGEETRGWFGSYGTTEKNLSQHINKASYTLNIQGPNLPTAL